MKKIILVCIVIFLILLLLFLWLINLKKPGSTDTTKIEYTQDPEKIGINHTGNTTHVGAITPGTVSPDTYKKDLIEKLMSLEPYTSYDFDIYYSSQLHKFLLTKKTKNADKAINDWAVKNKITGLFNLINGKNKNQDLFLIRDFTSPKEQGITDPEVLNTLSFSNEAIAQLSPTQQSNIEKLKTKPSQNNSFKIQYYDRFDTFIVEKKNKDADKAITEWAKENSVSDIITNPNIFVTSSGSADEFQKASDKSYFVELTPTLSPQTDLEKSANFLSIILNGLPDITGDPPGSVNSTPNPTGTSNIDVNILSLIQSYGLPPPTADFFNGANGYNSLKAKLSSDSNAGWNAKALLDGERMFEQKGGSIYKYLSTAWVWFENGAASYPDVYEVNCNDNRSLSQVSLLCSSHNFQVAGYQAADRQSDYKRIYTQLYGSSDVKSVMQQVIKNSNKAATSVWSYLDSGQQRGLVSSYLTGGTIPSNVSLSDISPNSQGFFDEKTQFYSLLIGKDPNMAAALNGITIKGDNLPGIFSTPIDSPSRPHWANYIKGTEMQLISNMIAALYLYDSGSSDVNSPNPTSQSGNPIASSPMASQILRLVDEIKSGCTQLGAGHVTSSNYNCLDNVSALTAQARTLLKTSARNYADLQCVGFVVGMVAQVTGQNIAGHGNAIDYSYNIPNGYRFIHRGSEPVQVDDIPIWNYDTVGHIAIVVHVYDNNHIQVAEANVTPGTVGTRLIPLNNSTIKGWLRKL